MSSHTAQYSATLKFNGVPADASQIEERLVELGMDREAFHICLGAEDSADIRFWEPDQDEAQRFLQKIRELQ
jgi:hypothetical protein